MKAFLNLVNRHLIYFFKDKINVLFTVISLIVVLSLYFLFIKDFTIDAIKQVCPANNIEQFTDQSMLIGLILVTGFSASLGMLNLFIKDISNHVINDFLITPHYKITIYTSYLFASVVISLFFSTLGFFLIIFYLNNTYILNITSMNLLSTYFLIIINCIVSSLILMIIAFFIKTSQSFATIGNLGATIIGFIIGVYIPLGYYPDTIQSILVISPLSTIACATRNVFTIDILKDITFNLPSDVMHEIQKVFGCTLSFNNDVLSLSQLYQVIFGLLFFIIVVYIIIQQLKT